MIDLTIRQLVALAYYAKGKTHDQRPHASARSALKRKKLLMSFGDELIITTLGEKALDDYGGAKYVVAKYVNTAAPSFVDPELRAPEIAAMFIDGADVRTHDLAADEYAGWLVHEYDNPHNLAELTDGELAGWLARQIVEHDANHVEPATDPHVFVNALLESLFGVERMAIVWAIARSNGQDVVTLLRRALDEHAVKQGRGADVERIRRRSP